MTRLKMEVLKTMKKSNIEVEELIGVLEKIRGEKYPEIPETLIREIVATEFEQQDDRAQARKNTKKLIDEFLKNVRPEEVG